MKWEI